MSRNSLSYIKEEYNWYRQQAQHGSLAGTLIGWSYYGPILLITLIWWALTRVVGVPYALLVRAWRWLRRRMQ